MQLPSTGFAFLLGLFLVVRTWQVQTSRWSCGLVQSWQHVRFSERFVMIGGSGSKVSKFFLVRYLHKLLITSPLIYFFKANILHRRNNLLILFCRSPKKSSDLQTRGQHQSFSALHPRNLTWNLNMMVKPSSESPEIQGLNLQVPLLVFGGVLLGWTLRCFLNAAVQSLAHAPLLADFFLKQWEAWSKGPRGSGSVFCEKFGWLFDMGVSENRDTPKWMV